MKPKGLKESTILMCVFNLAAYVFLDPKSPYLAIGLTVGTIIVIVSILNLLGIKKHNMAEVILIVLEAALGVYLLWWLNVREVKTHFLKTSNK